MTGLGRRSKPPVAESKHAGFRRNRINTPGDLYRLRVWPSAITTEDAE